MIKSPSLTIVEGSQVEKIISIRGVSPHSPVAHIKNGTNELLLKLNINLFLLYLNTNTTTILQTSHTILLTQPARNKASRSYSDHETISLAIEGKTVVIQSIWVD